MELGELLLVSGLWLVLANTALLLFERRLGLEKASLVASIAAAGVLAAGYSFFTLNIFGDNFAYLYVLEHSARALSPILKLSVAWTGQEGSIFLWTLLVALSYLGFRILLREHSDEALVRRSFFIFSLVYLALLLITVISNPFRLAEEHAADGHGLNPLLRTFWNVIHPPLVFVGYATTVVPFSIAMARMSLPQSDRELRSSPARLESYLDLMMALSWLFLTLGIFLGGYWAYLTLGWGGYWAWDPVETSSLISWLLCTAYFHTKGLLNPRKFEVSSLAMLTGYSVFFATAVTRGGLVYSVHGFPTSPVAQAFVAVLLGIFVAYVALTVRNWRYLSAVKVRNQAYFVAMWLCLISILGLAAISFTGIFVPIVSSMVSGVERSVGPDFYNIMSTPFTLILVLTVPFCTFTKAENRRILKVFLLPMMLGGVALWLLSFPTSSPLANLLLAPTVITLGVLFARVFFDLRYMSIVKSPRVSARTFLHLGLVLVLLGVLLSANLKATYQGWYDLGSPIPLGRDALVVSKATISYVGSDSYTVMVTVRASDSGSSIGAGDVLLSQEPRWGSYGSILVLSTLTKDFYVSMENARWSVETGSFSQVYLKVSVVPYISLLWLGSIVAIAAIAALTVMYVRRLVATR